MYKICKPKETTNKHGSCQWLWGKKRSDSSWVQDYPSIQHVTPTRILFLSIYPMTGFFMRSHQVSIPLFSWIFVPLLIFQNSPVYLFISLLSISPTRTSLSDTVATCDQELLPVVQKALSALQEALLGSAALDCKHHQSRVLIFLVTARSLASRKVPDIR